MGITYMPTCWLSTLNNKKTTRYIVLQFYCKNAEIHSYRYIIHMLFSSIRNIFRGFRELNTTPGNMQGYKMIGTTKDIQINKEGKRVCYKIGVETNKIIFPDK